MIPQPTRQNPKTLTARTPREQKWGRKRRCLCVTSVTRASTGSFTCRSTWTLTENPSPATSARGNSGTQRLLSITCCDTRRGSLLPSSARSVTRPSKQKCTWSLISSCTRARGRPSAPPAGRASKLSATCRLIRSFTHPKSRTSARSAGRVSGTRSRCSATEVFTLVSILTNARCVAKLLQRGDRSGHTSRSTEGKYLPVRRVERASPSNTTWRDTFVFTQVKNRSNVKSAGWVSSRTTSWRLTCFFTVPQSPSCVTCVGRLFSTTASCRNTRKSLTMKNTGPSWEGKFENEGTAELSTDGTGRLSMWRPWAARPAERASTPCHYWKDTSSFTQETCSTPATRVESPFSTKLHTIIIDGSTQGNGLSLVMCVGRRSSSIRLSSPTNCSTPERNHINASCAARPSGSTPATEDTYGSTQGRSPTSVKCVEWDSGSSDTSRFTCRSTQERNRTPVAAVDSDFQTQDCSRDITVVRNHRKC